MNSIPATLATRIAPGDTVETAPDGELVFVLAEDAFILRGNSRVVIERPPANSAVVTALRLATGKLLSVFGRGQIGRASCRERV